MTEKAHQLAEKKPNSSLTVGSHVARKFMDPLIALSNPRPAEDIETETSTLEKRNAEDNQQVQMRRAVLRGS